VRASGWRVPCTKLRQSAVLKSIFEISGSGGKNALKKHLKKKLETLKSSEKTQIFLIVIWLVDIYLNKLTLQREGETLLRNFSHF
jgi:hypothetical protein